jgi:hypothetical protein
MKTDELSGHVAYKAEEYEKCIKPVVGKLTTICRFKYSGLYGITWKLIVGFLRVSE